MEKRKKKVNKMFSQCYKTVDIDTYRKPGINCMPYSMASVHFPNVIHVSNAASNVFTCHILRRCTTGDCLFKQT